MRRQAVPNKNTTPAILTNPVGIDTIVKAVQVKMSADLLWLEKSFNRATVMSRKDTDDEEHVYPVCWTAQGKDEFPMIGNDNWSAYSFFVARETETPVDYEQFDTTYYERELSLYVWINLNKAQVLSPFDYPENLKQEVLSVLKNTVFVEDETLTIDGIEDDPLEIFSGFTIDPTDTQLLYNDYYGLRIDLTCTYADIEVCVEALPAPTNLLLSNITTTSMQLDWSLNSNGDEASVSLERNDAGAGFAVIASLPPGTQAYPDTLLIDNTTYDYRVQSISGGEPFTNSLYSNIATGTTLSTIDPDAKVWIDRMTSPSTFQQEVINNLVVRGKSVASGNWWGVTDEVYLFQLGAINGLVGSGSVIAVGYGGLTFSNLGAIFNGVNAYIDSNYIPSIGSNYAIENCSMNMFVKEDFQTNPNAFYCGVTSVTNNRTTIRNLGYLFANVNTAQAAVKNPYTFTNNKLYACGRNGGGTQQVYADGVSEGTSPAAGITVSTDSLYIGRARGSVTGFHGTSSAFSVGGNIDQTAYNHDIRLAIASLIDGNHVSTLTAANIIINSA